MTAADSGTAPLRMAVVGAGIMGSNHARVIRHLVGVELVAVVDPDLARASAACGPSSAVAVATLDELGDDVDAAVVAVPTAGHVAAASVLLERGIHVLVEKPLAPTVAEAEHLVDLADTHGVVLAVGHVEQFNPAVWELTNWLDEPIHIEASRIGPYSARVSDGVILDLMIHDLGIVQSLFDDDVEATSISGASRAVRSQSEDVASAVVTYSNGVTATFNTSRLGQQKTRLVEVTQADSTIIADLIRRDVTIHRMTRSEYLSDDGTRYRQSSVVEVPFLESNAEPLHLELNDFATSIRTGTRPRVDGRSGLRSLDLALRVTATIAC